MAQNARRKRSCLTCARFTSRGSLMWLCLLVMAWSSSSWRLFSSPDESSVGMHARVRYSTSSTVLPAFATPEPESTTPVEYPAKVTCGSVIKVLNKSMKLYLRSQEIQYGSGSGMQTVTAFDIAEEAFNYWTVYCVKEESPGHWSTYSDGSAVKTGTKIALRHLPSKRFLTSHQYRSPLTNQQEVCGAGDESVNERNPMVGSFAIWKISLKDASKGEVWKQDKPVAFQHVETKLWLITNRHALYSNPLRNHAEVACGKSKQEWLATEGVYFGARDVTSGTKDASEPVVAAGTTMKIHTEL